MENLPICQDMIFEISSWRSKIMKKKIKKLEKKLEFFKWELIHADIWGSSEWMFHRGNRYWMPIYLENELYDCLRKSKFNRSMIEYYTS